MLSLWFQTVIRNAKPLNTISWADKSSHLSVLSWLLAPKQKFSYFYKMSLGLVCHTLSRTHQPFPCLEMPCLYSQGPGSLGDLHFSSSTIHILGVNPSLQFCFHCERTLCTVFCQPFIQTLNNSPRVIMICNQKVSISMFRYSYSETA